MSREEHDGIRAHLIEHGWGDWPPIIVDEFGNLIDGYKRSQIAWELGITNAPAVVIQGAERFPDEAERAVRYAELRARLNDKTVLTDEIEAWLKEIRNG